MELYQYLFCNYDHQNNYSNIDLIYYLLVINCTTLCLLSYLLFSKNNFCNDLPYPICRYELETLNPIKDSFDWKKLSKYNGK